MPNITDPVIVSIPKPIGIYPVNYLKSFLSKYNGSHNKTPYNRALSIHKVKTKYNTSGFFIF